MNTFNFQDNSVEIMSLETLKRTHKENDIYGSPLKDLYHYQYIEKIANLCENAGLDFEIEEIFAAQNKSRQLPGVVLLPQVEAQHGINAVEAHILRRVYSTIRIKDGEDSETTTTIAIAYHQDGIQVGFGPCVRVCHNQTIMGSERISSNYGKSGVTTNEMFATVGKWLDNFFEYRETDLRIIEQMKQINCTQEDVLRLIGMLTSLRVMKDSDNKNLSSQVKQYPFTQSQISRFTEDYLERNLQTKNTTLWDVYNIATELYKPDKMEIPNVLNQNFEFVNVVRGIYNF